MSYTVQQTFSDFRSNLEITDLQTSTVSARQQRVREVVENAMKVKETFLTGSYARSTMIAPLKEADIDVFIVLDPEYFHWYNGKNGGPAGLLDYTKRTLLKTYTSTPSISRNGQAVTIRFNDFIVDVVVGFYRTGGGYLIPNSITQTWLSTDPRRHVEIMSAANARQNGKLVPLIKMLKAWNRVSGSVFRSFHLEVMALKIFAEVTITDFPSGARYFFDGARTVMRQPALDPAGYGDNVGRYLESSSKIEDASERLQQALNISLRAEQSNLYGRNQEAIDQWGRVFRDRFPLYG